MGDISGCVLTRAIKQKFKTSPFLHGYDCC